MGSLKFLPAFILLFTALRLHASGDTVLHATMQQMHKGSFSNFYADNLGNVYLITANNQVKKYSDKGDSVGLFNDVRRYGDIWSMDVTNPLRIIVYYKDFTTALVLDRFLNTRNVIDLRNAGITQVKAVAQSYDNNIWVYDELDNKIKKIDEQGKLVFESVDFRLLFDDAVMPDKIIDYNRALYLYDKNNGWYLFDYYGAFQKKLPYTNWKDVQVADNFLSGYQNNQLISLPLNNFAADATALRTSIDITTALKAQYQNGRLYVLNAAGLTIYSLQ
ncbi:hypothetical protein [Foetidibacter luteolus]|uniref:hypothetical protein n=1 Tax=Foetidibacter luteolus TaxID=2608880 RepID=UPI00129B318A|nr:hypothetical protein [Foetidibacter luteolus]